MALLKKYDFGSILDSLDAMMEYDYNGNERNSIYFTHYQEQITELAVLAADMYEELGEIRVTLRYEMPEKRIEFCGEDASSQTAVA